MNSSSLSPLINSLSSPLRVLCSYIECDNYFSSAYLNLSNRELSILSYPINHNPTANSLNNNNNNLSLYIRWNHINEWLKPSIIITEYPLESPLEEILKSSAAIIHKQKSKPFNVYFDSVVNNVLLDDWLGMDKLKSEEKLNWIKGKTRNIGERAVIMSIGIIIDYCLSNSNKAEIKESVYSERHIKPPWDSSVSKDMLVAHTLVQGIINISQIKDICSTMNSMVDCGFMWIVE
jgi:hypothetical protein